MQKVIIYHSIQSDHILAVPQETHRETIETKSMAKLREYVETQMDAYGHKFKKSSRQESFGFDYLSKEGGVKIEDPPEVKRI